MSRIIGTKRRKVAVLVTAAALLAISAAVAAWVISATGPGAARAGTLVAPTITADSAAAGAAPLFPGQTGPLYVKVNNTNNAPVYLATTGNTLSFTGPVVSGASGTCALSDWTLPATYFSPSITVPANANTSIAIPGVVTLNANAQIGCQGATITETVTGVASLVNG